MASNLRSTPNRPTSPLHASSRLLSTEQVCASRRMGDIGSAVGGPHPNAVARDEAGKVVGYTTGSYLSGHTVALSEEALQALVVAQSAAIAAAQAAGAPIPPPTLFVPHQHSGFAR